MSKRNPQPRSVSQSRTPLVCWTLNPIASAASTYGRVKWGYGTSHVARCTWPSLRTTGSPSHADRTLRPARRLWPPTRRNERGMPRSDGTVMEKLGWYWMAARRGSGSRREIDSIAARSATWFAVASMRFNYRWFVTADRSKIEREAGEIDRTITDRSRKYFCCTSFRS